MWYFRYDKKLFCQERFNLNQLLILGIKKLLFKHLSCLEKRLLDLDIPFKRFNNLTKDERNAMYSLKNDKSKQSKVLTRVRQ